MSYQQRSLALRSEANDPLELRVKDIFVHSSKYLLVFLNIFADCLESFAKYNLPPTAATSSSRSSNTFIKPGTAAGTSAAKVHPCIGNESGAGLFWPNLLSTVKKLGAPTFRSARAWYEVCCFIGHSKLCAGSRRGHKSVPVLHPIQRMEKEGQCLQLSTRFLETLRYQASLNARTVSLFSNPPGRNGGAEARALGS